MRRGDALLMRGVKRAKVVAHEAKAAGHPGDVDIGRGPPEHGSAEHSATARGRRHGNARVVAVQRISRRGLTVLAADERLAEARCARDDVTARSRSWR